MKRVHPFLEVAMISIKPLEENEISKFIEIHLKCWEETYFAIFPKEVIQGRWEKFDKRKEHIKKRLKNDNYFYYCLKDDFNIVGILIFSIIDNTGILDAIYIKKEYQHLGYGKKLLNIAKKVLKERDIKECYLYLFKMLPNKDFFIKENAQFIKEEEISIHGKDYKELEYKMEVGN